MAPDQLSAEGLRHFSLSFLGATGGLVPSAKMLRKLLTGIPPETSYFGLVYRLPRVINPPLASTDAASSPHTSRHYIFQNISISS